MKKKLNSLKATTELFKKYLQNPRNFYFHIHFSSIGLS
jgi:hypothetical protein